MIGIHVLPPGVDVIGVITDANSSFIESRPVPSSFRPRSLSLSPFSSLLCTDVIVLATTRFPIPFRKTGVFCKSFVRTDDELGRAEFLELVIFVAKCR